MLTLEALLSKRCKVEDRKDKTGKAYAAYAQDKNRTARLRSGMAPEAHITSCLHSAMTTVLLSMVRRKFMSHILRVFLCHSVRVRVCVCVCLCVCVFRGMGFNGAAAAGWQVSGRIEAPCCGARKCL
jgi:hypothetical protein